MKIAILYSSHRLLGQPKDIFTIEIMNATFCFYKQKIRDHSTSALSWVLKETINCKFSGLKMV